MLGYSYRVSRYYKYFYTLPDSDEVLTIKALGLYDAKRSISRRHGIPESLVTVWTPGRKKKGK